MAKTVFNDTPPLGTIVTAAWLNLIQNHRHNGLDADGSCPIDYAIDTGAANAYAATYTPVISAHITGLPLLFKAVHANTGASTFNPGPGAIAIKRKDGTALQAGDIPAGGMIIVIHDGTYYQLESANPTLYYASDTGAANAYAATYSPALTAHVTGLSLCFKATNANTGASTFNPGPGAVAIKRKDGTALQAGDIPAGGMCIVIYDGTYYQLQSANVVSLNYYTNSLSADVALTNSGQFYTGPSVAQPNGTGIWLAIGQISLNASDHYILKLWDGSTVFSSVNRPLSIYSHFRNNY
jgi:hypothetical protein